MAIADTAEKKATLREIIDYIEKHFSYYRSNKKWYGSIRHNLTINDCFLKLPRQPGNKCSLWKVDSAFKDMFDNGSLRRRRYRFKEGTHSWNKSKLNNLSRSITPNMHPSSANNGSRAFPSTSSTMTNIHTTSTNQVANTSQFTSFEATNLAAVSSMEQAIPVSTESSLSSSNDTTTSWPSSVDDLDEILNSIDSYDKKQAELQATFDAV